MKKFILLTSSLTLALGASIAISAGAPVGNIFQSGQPAIAADVNANFQELADRIDTVPVETVYNYADYIPSGAQTNVFSITRYNNITYCQAKLEYEYTHTTENGNAVLKRKDTNIDSAGVPCITDTLRVRTFVKGSNSLDYTTATTTYISTGNVSTTTYEQPRNVLINNMQKGQTWGSSGIRTTVSTGVGGGTSTSTDILLNSLTNIESVTVPYAGGTTYNNCLKIIKTSPYVQTYYVGGGASIDVPIQRVFTRWYCPSVGLVKTITPDGLYELSNIK